MFIEDSGNGIREDYSFLQNLARELLISVLPRDFFFEVFYEHSEHKSTQARDFLTLFHRRRCAIC